jgi:hypothetical protein
MIKTENEDEAVIGYGRTFSNEFVLPIFTNNAGG